MFGVNKKITIGDFMKINEIITNLEKTKEQLEKLNELIRNNYSSGSEKQISELVEQIQILTIKMNETEFWKSHKEYLVTNELEELNNLYVEHSEDYTYQEISLIEDGNFYNNINLNIFFKNFKDLIQEEINQYKEKGLKLRLFLHKLEIIPALNQIFEKNIKLFSLAPILDAIITEKQSTIIVGQNGVGKSELLKSLKEINLKNCVVIPANKNLFIDKITEYVDNENINNRVRNQKFKDLSYNIYNSSSSNSGMLSYLVSFYVTENCKRKLDNNELSESSKLDEVKKIWKRIFPEIEIFTESGERILEFSKNRSEKYPFNQLSDGERSALYYILLICLFEKESLIIVDEPETHLNIALCNKLWDILLEERKESKFVFISHNKDFIISRVHSDIIWCKNYDVNNKENNEFIKIENNDTLPKDLIVSLLGSKKEKILFCEGVNREGKTKKYDYRMYNLLYSDEYFVKPVEGHLSVIEYTKAYNKLKEELEIYSKEAYGIIDRDCLNNDEVQNLKNKNIVVLPVNEIEMLLLHEKIMINLLNLTYKSNQVDEKIKNFKNKFKTEINDNVTKLKLEYAKLRSEKILEKEKFQKYNSISDLRNSKRDLFEKINLDKFITERENEIRTIISNDDYNGMLKICSLKEGQIIGKIVHSEIDRDYIEKAFNIIEKSEELQSILRQYIGLPFNNKK